MSTPDANPQSWTAPTAEMALLSEGDQAWSEGDRREAARLYQRAAAGEDPAAEAMARVRLLHFTGNISLAVQGPRLDRALEACGATPWCHLAWADYHLLAPTQVGARRAEATRHARLAERELPGPALARLALADGSASALEALSTLPHDGLGDAVLEHKGLPDLPGTWFLGFGATGAPGLGAGGALRFVHPDLFWRRVRLESSLGALSRGSAWLSNSLVSPDPVFGIASLSLSRQIVDIYADDGRTRREQELASALFSTGPGLRFGRHTLSGGGTARWDLFDGERSRGHGPWLHWSWNQRVSQGAETRGLLLYAGLDSGLPSWGSDHRRLNGRISASKLQGAPLSSTLASRIVLEGMASRDAPLLLQPSAGGADLLRGAPAGRYRGMALAAADLEIRHRLAGPLSGALFVDAAWVEGNGGLHEGGGTGLRLILPPGDWNVFRLDLAASDAGWGLSAGWGELF